MNSNIINVRFEYVHVNDAYVHICNKKKIIVDATVADAAHTMFREYIIDKIGFQLQTKLPGAINVQHKHITTVKWNWKVNY